MLVEVSQPKQKMIKANMKTLKNHLFMRYITDDSGSRGMPVEDLTDILPAKNLKIGGV
jgi:hypothetical protein